MSNKDMIIATRTFKLCQIVKCIQKARSLGEKEQSNKENKENIFRFIKDKSPKITNWPEFDYGFEGDDNIVVTFYSFGNKEQDVLFCLMI